jgi:hypothetical protein
VILEDRKTVRMAFCMLVKSGEVVIDCEDVEDEDDVDDAVEAGRNGRLEYVPRLIVTTGYTATSRGGRCIMKGLDGAGTISPSGKFSESLTEKAWCL